MSKKKKYTHMIIPDTQVKDGDPIDHLGWAGEYAAEKRPDVIIMIGDFADMPSLSSYDIGKKSYEGRSYKADIDSARKGMALFLDSLSNNRGNKQAVPYKPRLVLTLGNHENRIDRAIDADRKLDGTISTSDLGYRESGWEVFPFLEVVKIHGVYYSHYFTSGVAGRPITSARAILTKKHCSAVMGHVQRQDIAKDYKPDGEQLTAIFAGGFYQHDEDYLGPQGNRYKRGIWMLHNVCDGSFDETFVPIDYLKERYHGKERA